MFTAAHLFVATALGLLLLAVARARRAAEKNAHDAPRERQRRRPIIVVIGANRGIGFEIARQLVSRGDRTVVMTARDVSVGREAQKRAVASTIESMNYDPPLLFAPFDVRNASHRRGLAAHVARHFHRLDGLVCSAGISDKRRSDAATTRDVLATNVHGTAATIRSLLPSLRSAGGSARIVVVTSQRGRLDILNGRARAQVEAATTAADVETICLEYEHLRCSGDPKVAVERGWPEADAYGVSKLFGIALTRALAEELRPDGIYAVAACPGWCRTDMGTSMAPRSASEGADTPSYLAAMDSSELSSGALYHDRKVIPW